MTTVPVDLIDLTFSIGIVCAMLIIVWKDL